MLPVLLAGMYPPRQRVKALAHFDVEVVGDRLRADQQIELVGGRGCVGGRRGRSWGDGYRTSAAYHFRAEGISGTSVLCAGGPQKCKKVAPALVKRFRRPSIVDLHAGWVVPGRAVLMGTAGSLRLFHPRLPR